MFAIPLLISGKSNMGDISKLGKMTVNGGDASPEPQVADKNRGIGDHNVEIGRAHV